MDTFSVEPTESSVKEIWKRLRTRPKQDESESKTCKEAEIDTLTQQEVTLRPHFPDPTHHENSSKLTMTDSSMHLDSSKIFSLICCVAKILKMKFIKMK